MKNAESFNSALYGVSENLRKILCELPYEIRQTAEEIRLRAGSPLSITLRGESFFVKYDRQLTKTANTDCVTVTKEELEQSYKLICSNSAFAHAEELKEGFVSMKNGCRAGICGTFADNGFIKQVNSVNIRIAREILGVSNQIASRFSGNGILIAGPPASGKTTILRDLILELSKGEHGRSYRICVIDQRSELSGGIKNGSINDLGPNTDIIITKDKAKGIEIALRTMFPEIIAFDEIGTEAELERVTESLFSGVAIITTAHVGSYRELMQRGITSKLIKSGVVSDIVLLSDVQSKNIQIISAEELIENVAV